MTHENQNEITFEGLQQYLCRIGFDLPVKVNHSLAFHHRDSGTIIALSIPVDGRSVRPADWLSTLTRLEHQGLVDAKTVAQFRSGKLPLAS